MSARKTLKNSSILSGTPTQQPSLSPSRKKITKSPVSTSKYLAQSNNKPNVSYGELQIVLQNIQQIRVKANNQVKALNVQNNQLKEQLVHSQEIIKDLNDKIQKYQKIQKESDQKTKWQLSAIEKHKDSLQTQLQSKQKRIIMLQVKNKELQKGIQNEMNKFQIKNKQIEEYKNKWKWAFTILAGNQQRAEEIIWKVKNQYKGGLWNILQTHTEQGKSFDLQQQQINLLQKQIEMKNDKNCQISTLLDKCREELNNSRIKITKYEQQAKLGQQQSIHIHSITQQLKTQIEQLKHSVEQKNQSIAGMRQQLLQTKRKRQYQNLIDELCEDSQQSAQLLQRELAFLQYLKDTIPLQAT